MGLIKAFPATAGGTHRTGRTRSVGDRHSSGWDRHPEDIPTPGEPGVGCSRRAVRDHLGRHVAVSFAASLPAFQGVAIYRLVRYSDDFVILMTATREQAEALRSDTAALLARQG